MRLLQKWQIHLKYIWTIRILRLISWLSTVDDKHKTPESANIEQPKEEFFESLRDGLLVIFADCFDEFNWEIIITTFSNDSVDKALKMNVDEV
jgi:hypothetical protein